MFDVVMYNDIVSINFDGEILKMFKETAIQLANELLSVTQSEQLENYSSLKIGDVLWYPNEELEIVEKAVIDSIDVEHNQVTRVNLNFIECNDFDSFDGMYLGRCLFIDRSRAENNLRKALRKDKM